MRFKTALLALPLSLLLIAPAATFADSLTLTSTAGGSTGGIDVFPYVFTVTVGSYTATNVYMSCLNFNREIQIGESWAVNTTNLSTLTSSIDGSSLTALREDAYLDALYGTAPHGDTDSEIQFAIWNILDPSDVSGTSGFDSKSQQLVIDAQNAAVSESSAFLSQFILFTPVVPVGDTNPTNPSNSANPSNWRGLGEPQQFMLYIPSTPSSVPPTAVTPEPSSLLLFGTGLIGTVGIMRRKYAQTAA